MYIVLGATHPHVKERHGETYRLRLENRAQRLGVDSSVIFHNRFVSQGELTEFISAADIYITPYLNPSRSPPARSPTRSGPGKAVISTPYWYAREMLADGRGVLVPWRDPEAIAREVIGLLGDDAKRHAMRRARGRATGATCSGRRWRGATCESFERARVEHAARCRTVFQAKTLAERPAELPELEARSPAAHDR